MLYLNKVINEQLILLNYGKLKVSFCKCKIKVIFSLLLFVDHLRVFSSLIPDGMKLLFKVKVFRVSYSKHFDFKSLFCTQCWGGEVVVPMMDCTGRFGRRNVEE